MSRIGRMPITIPAGVDIKIDGNVVTVKGPKGTCLLYTSQSPRDTTRSRMAGWA